MKRISMIVTMLLLPTFINFAIGQSPAKPGPEHKKLEALVGTWNVEGDVKPNNPFGPGGKYSGVERWEWLPGGFFLQMNREAKSPLGDMKAHFVMGYDPIAKKHTYSFFDNFGNSGSGTITITGNSWLWVGSGYTGGGKPAHERCTATFAVGASSYTLKCDGSSDGKTWSPEYEGRYTKSK